MLYLYFNEMIISGENCSNYLKLKGFASKRNDNKHRNLKFHYVVKKIYTFAGGENAVN